jgi:hypothetical protein
MPKLPGISHATAVREGKHTVMSNGRVRLVIPGHTVINAFTMADLAKDAGLTPEQFRELL